jgi:hypothetical protein
VGSSLPQRGIVDSYTPLKGGGTMIRKHFRFTRFALGLAIAAVAAPAAHATPVSLSGGVTPTLSQLQTEASRVYGSQGDIPTSSLHGGSTPTMAQLEQQAAQYRARLDATTPQVTASGSEEFQWTDAGIGASVTLGAALLLLTCVGLGSRYRSRSHNTALAST